MLSPTDILMLAVLPLLLACSAFFSGGETAIFSLTRHQRHNLSRATSRTAAIVTGLVKAKQSLLVTLLLGNMFVNVIYFVIGTVLILSLHERDVLSTFIGNVLNILAVLLLILTGEVLPKLVAARFAMAWVHLAAMPLMVIYRTLTPLRILLQWLLVEPISRLLAPRHRPQAMSVAELESMLKLSQERGVIDHEEEQMLQQVLSLGQLKVTDVMTPRVDLVAYDLNDDPQQLWDLARARKFSRIPVCRGDLDHIEGIVLVRQVLLHRPVSRDQVEALIRAVRFIPELQSASALLVEMRRRRTTVAIAVDEYGGTAGLVSLEDVVEHIVGDIPGLQAGPQVPRVVAIGPGQWRVSADLSIGRWSAVLGRFDRVAGVSTLGGLVTAGLGRIARAGDRLTMGNLTIEVEQMDRQRITTVRLELKDEREAGK